MLNNFKNFHWCYAQDYTRSCIFFTRSRLVSQTFNNASFIMHNNVFYTVLNQGENPLKP